MSFQQFPRPQVGDRLPDLAIPMDRTRIVAAAIASQDFEDVHHDPSKAAERGMPDIFISINSTNGLLDRYLTDWAGPTARIHKVALRLGVPLFPGDTLTLTGEVTAVEDGLVSVTITGSNARGVHVKATASLGDITRTGVKA
ncbi:MAG: MaoC/PaaZ C-terminal domain-containing protein [Nocardioides sp.]|uniref:MaoC/PaaZ C-terminal domain-containing protein n=1 Tax=Nocardioides sp. TaxID=35761 RepID=UPI0039E2875D